MTDKERFLNEIKEVKLIIQANRAQGAFSEGYLIGQESVLEHFEKSIDSMSEESISEDLEKASIKYAQDKYMPVQTSYAFKAGAQWCKQQMMKEAMDVRIDSSRSDGKTILIGNFFKYNTGNKVKIIIVKED